MLSFREQGGVGSYVIQMDSAVAQVKQLLVDAKDPDVLLTALPSLLEPRTLISVLVTVRKW